MNPFPENRALVSGPVIWAAIVIVTCLVLLVFQTVLWLVMPVLFAVFFCYVLAPWVNLGVSRGLTRSQAVFAVTVILWIFIIGLGLAIGPRVIRDARAFSNGRAEAYLRDASDLVDKARKTLADKFPLFHMAPPKPAVPAVAPLPADELKANLATWTDRYSGNIALEALHWVPSLLLVPYLTYFFLLDGLRLKRFIVRAIPNAFFEKTLYLFYRVEDQLRSYFRGLLLLTALDAACLGVGLFFLGLNAPFFLAIAAALMAWLPYLGSIAGCLMVVLVAHHDHPGNDWLPYEAIGLFIVVRLCDDFIFLPLTVGRSLRMHPLVTVLMILLGGAVAGIAGLLLVMPVLGVVMVIGQIGGELLTDARIIARFRYARELRHRRARDGLEPT
jgi:predicted PurR-regulated permease PerM